MILSVPDEKDALNNTQCLLWGAATDYTFIKAFRVQDRMGHARKKPIILSI